MIKRSAATIGFVLLLQTTSAFAGDYAFTCQGLSPEFQLEDGEIYNNGKALKPLQKRTIDVRKMQGHCTTKAGKQYTFSNNITLVETKVNHLGSRFNLYFVCEEASSGIPANVNDCSGDVITSDKRLVPNLSETLGK